MSGAACVAGGGGAVRGAPWSWSSWGWVSVRVALATWGCSGRRSGLCGWCRGGLVPEQSLRLVPERSPPPVPERSLRPGRSGPVGSPRNLSSRQRPQRRPAARAGGAFQPRSPRRRGCRPSPPRVATGCRPRSTAPVAQWRPWFRLLPHQHASCRPAGQASCWPALVRRVVNAARVRRSAAAKPTRSPSAVSASRSLAISLRWWVCPRTATTLMSGTSRRAQVVIRRDRPCAPCRAVSACDDIGPVRWSRSSCEARPAGLEPAALGLEVPCSIQLSYGRLSRSVTVDATAPRVAARAHSMMPASRWSSRT